MTGATRGAIAEKNLAEITQRTGRGFWDYRKKARIRTRW